MEAWRKLHGRRPQMARKIYRIAAQLMQNKGGLPPPLAEISVLASWNDYRASWMKKGTMIPIDR